MVKKTAPFKKGDKVITKHSKVKGKIGFKHRGRDLYFVKFPDRSEGEFSSKQLNKQ
jgi:hypothetical protein